MKSLSLVSNDTFEISTKKLNSLSMGSCRIRISFTGICSSDVERGLDNGAYFYPLVMGHEIAGHVVEQSDDVQGDWVGKPVSVFPLKPCFQCSYCLEKKYMRCSNYDYYGSRCDGGFSDYLDVNAWNLIEIPSSVEMIDACLTEPCAVVNHALSRFDQATIKKPGCRIGIIGSGFLGLIASDLIRIKNPTGQITLIDRNQFKLSLGQMADTKIKLSNDNDRYNFEEAYRDYFDIILEATGTVSSIHSSLACIKPGGSIVLMGNMKDGLVLNQKTLDSIIRNEITISGTWNSDFKNGKVNDWAKIMKLYENGFCPSKYVTDEVDLKNIPRILRERLQHKRGEKISSVIKAVYKNV